MGRIRTIKPEFFKHEQLFDAEKESGLPLRLSYAGLWTQADRAGRFAWRPRQLKTDILPYEEVDFERVLGALVASGHIEKYEIDGVTYGRIRSFGRHQVINNKERDSEIPPSPEEQMGQKTDACGTREARVDDATATREARVIATTATHTTDSQTDEPVVPSSAEVLENRGIDACATREVRDDHATGTREARVNDAYPELLFLSQGEGKGKEGKGKEQGSGSDACATRDASLAAASDFKKFFITLRGIFATLYEKNYDKKYPGDPHDRTTAENAWEKLRDKPDWEQWIADCLDELFARESKPRTLYYCEAKLIDDYDKATKISQIKNIRMTDPGLIKKLQAFLTDTQIDALLMKHPVESITRAYRKLCGYGLNTEQFRERFYQQLTT